MLATVLGLSQIQGQHEIKVLSGLMQIHASFHCWCQVAHRMQHPIEIELINVIPSIFAQAYAGMRPNCAITIAPVARK